MAFDLLAGIRAVDMTQYLPGPFAAQILSDMGADVLKVEPPTGDPFRTLDPFDGDHRPTPFHGAVNAGKRIVRLDLKTDEGRDAMARLLAAADVLVESYRPGVMDRLGFGRQALEDLNPGLVHCALSGFGQTGPHRLLAGHDLNYVAFTGALSASGHVAGPGIYWPPVADMAGAMQAGLTIAGALVRRSRTGKGAFLDVSLAETVLGWQGMGLTQALNGRGAPDRAQATLTGGAAYYQLYETADGRWVSLSPIEPKFWANFCDAVGHPEWTDRQHEPLPQTDLTAQVAALFKSRDRAHWDGLLMGIDCCYYPVRAYAEVPTDPHVAARGLVADAGDHTEARFPLHLDDAPPPSRVPVVEVGLAEALAAWA